MNQKMQLAIDNIENRIKWEQEYIDRCLATIRERAASASEYEIITFIPAKIEELREATERRKNLAEQLQILNFIQKEN